VPVLRPCSGVGVERCGVLVEQPPCPVHRRVRARLTIRAKRGRRPYTYAEQVRRAEAVAVWLAEHGPWCPGWGRPGHWVVPDDLTADHPWSVAQGGHEGQPLSVLCRECNGCKGDRDAP